MRAIISDLVWLGQRNGPTSAVNYSWWRLVWSLRDHQLDPPRRDERALPGRPHDRVALDEEQERASGCVPERSLRRVGCPVLALHG